MKINKNSHKKNEDGNSAEDPFDELQYSAFKGKKLNFFKSGDRNELSFILMGIFILVLIVFFVVFYPESQKTTDPHGIDNLGEKLNTIQEKIVGIESDLKKFEILEARIERAYQLIYKHKSILADESLKINQLEKNIAGRQELKAVQLRQQNKHKSGKSPKKIIAPKTVKTYKKKAAPEKNSQTVEKKIATKYHTVRPGETLFSISRLYGMTIDELRALNKSISGSDIFPKQQLLIYSKAQ